MARRVLLATGAVALAASLFLPFFPRVSGWEHWAWADVVLAALAAALAGAAATGVRRAAVLLPLAALCGLGVAVALGHGFEPDARALTVVRAGPYLALAGLAAGAVGALASWPRDGGRVLLVAGAAGIVAALLSGWGTEEQLRAVFFGPPDDPIARAPDPATNGPSGFERWRALDVALLALAAGLLWVASGRAPRAVRLAIAAGCALSVACVAVDAVGRSAPWSDGRGVAEGAALGALAALLSLAAALAGLALTRPARAARAG